MNGDIRRRQVLDVSAVLFHERGYTGTSMDDVAEAVGLSKGTLYHHFSSKADLLHEVYEESVDFVLERIQQHPADATPTELVRLLIADTLDLVIERRHHVTVFYQEMRWLREWLPRGMARPLETKMRKYREYIRGVMRKGTESGEFRELDEVISSYALLGMASWTYQWFEPEGRLSRDEVVNGLTDIFLSGIRA
jgi:AcrR family transcriptional regulator